MSLAVSYTNESLQNQALNMLVNWLKCNGNYQNLVPPTMTPVEDEILTSTIIKGPNLKEVQQLFLTAVQQKHPQIDPDIQEALGVLFNLSSEYDKAVDCFQAALQVRPNAKTWNRLGMKQKFSANFERNLCPYLQVQVWQMVIVPLKLSMPISVH